MWQDVLLMAGCFGFSIALIPAIRANEKPPMTTSFISGSILCSFCVAYATLNFWLAFSATLVLASMWYTLFFQRALRRRTVDDSN